MIIIILFILLILSALWQVALFRPFRSIFWKWKWFYFKSHDTYFTLDAPKNLQENVSAVAKSESMDEQTNSNDPFHWFKGLFEYIAVLSLLEYSLHLMAKSFSNYGWWSIPVYLCLVFFIWFSLGTNLLFHYLLTQPKYRDLERSWPWRSILKKKD
jgi:hypothetical protein